MKVKPLVQLSPALLLRVSFSDLATYSLEVPFPLVQAQHSDEMPLKDLADSIGGAFGPALDAIAEEQRKRATQEVAEKQELYVPNVPHILPITKWASHNETLRDVLVFEEEKRIKPRLSWYDPYDTTWVPNGWFTDGIKADLNYYFSENRSPAKSVAQVEQLSQQPGK